MHNPNLSSLKAEIKKLFFEKICCVHHVFLYNRGMKNKNEYYDEQMDEARKHSWEDRYWEEEALKRGMDIDDAYDLRRDTLGR